MDHLGESKEIVEHEAEEYPQIQIGVPSDPSPPTKDVSIRGGVGEMGPPISASLGAMRPLVWNLDKLLRAPPPGCSSNSVLEGMHNLKNDVESLSSCLHDLAELEDPPAMAKCWMNEARDLSYDMDDYINSFFLRPAEDPCPVAHNIKTTRFYHKCFSGARTPKKLTWEEQIEGTVSAFKTYVKDAMKRYEVYNLKIFSTGRVVSVGRMLTLSYEETSDIIIDGRVNEFINSLVANNEANQLQLKVVSILGSSCLGKTTVARVLYNKLGKLYDCRAFVRVSKKPYTKTIFRDMLSQLQRQDPPLYCNEIDLINNIDRYLQDKRYLVIIDDLWDTTVWDILSRSFPKGTHGSRIITTTEIEDVAFRCCHYQSENVFEMKPLDDRHSRKLFFNRLFGSENSCPQPLKEVSSKIIQICGGLPLATISIASLLASQPYMTEDILKQIHESLSSCFSASSTSERTRQALNLSFNHLPHYLKTCLMYLRIYPEGNIFWRHDVMKQWMAECFIDTAEGQNMEEVAGSYLDELVARRFIQPIYVNYNNEVLSFAVHDTVHDIIAQKSAEQNFIVAIEDTAANVLFSHKARRLSLLFGDARYAKIPANIGNSQVRSLTYSGFFEFKLRITEFKLLRILNLQLSGHECYDDPVDLSGISELFQLRYLKIMSDVCIKLPKHGLQCLETLDITDARVDMDRGVPCVPNIHLPHLLHLSLSDEINLVKWINSLVCDSKLNNLQDLHITTSSRFASDNDECIMGYLVSIISSDKLKIIVVSHGSVRNEVVPRAYKVADAVKDVTLPPLLQRFEFVTHNPIAFSRIPPSVENHVNLCILKIEVRDLETSCVDILRGLPALRVLSLYVQTAPCQRIMFDKAGFSVLKYFKLRFTSGIAWLTFEADAMLNLRKIKLVFDAIPQIMDQEPVLYSNHPVFEHHKQGTPVINIEHMPGLKEISVKFGGAAADVEYALRDGVTNHRSNPTINMQPVDYSCYGDDRSELKQQHDEILVEERDEYDQKQSDEIREEEPHEYVKQRVYEIRKEEADEYVKQQPDEIRKDEPDEYVKLQRVYEIRKEEPDEYVKQQRVYEIQKEEPDEYVKQQPDEIRKDEPDEYHKQQPDEIRKEEPDEYVKQQPEDNMHEEPDVLDEEPDDNLDEEQDDNLHEEAASMSRYLFATQMESKEPAAGEDAQNYEIDLDEIDIDVYPMSPPANRTLPAVEVKSGELMLDLSKYIMLLEGLVATVTYAAAFSPPGGVWLDTDAATGRLAGESIIRSTSNLRYRTFHYCNVNAFASSLMVIGMVLLGTLWHQKRNRVVMVRLLQGVMLVELVNLMGAYGAGTCRDKTTTIFSSLLLGVAFLYVVARMVVSPFWSVKQIYSANATVDKRLRKVLMLLASFAVSFTYMAGMSTPGGIWNAWSDPRPGHAILEDSHRTRLTVFLCFNAAAFVTSLLIIVVLLDKKLNVNLAYVCISIVLISLVVAYIAGSSMKTADTTLYVPILVCAVLAFISLLQFAVVQWWIETARATFFRTKIQEFYDSALKMLRGDIRTPRPGCKNGRKTVDKDSSLVLLLATLAATITYQAGLNPPGGVWPDNGGGHVAGDPILLTTAARRFKAFFYFNSTAFVASVFAIILVQNKLLLETRVLEAIMILDLFGLLGAYVAGSYRNVSTSTYVMALAGSVFFYVVVHTVFFTPKNRDTITDRAIELVEKRRKRLLLFAVLAMTITYQAGLTPPGGWQLQDDDGSSSNHAGDPILQHTSPRRYTAFFYCNSVSFMVSMALIILLVNPHLYRPAIQSYALDICTAAAMLGLVGAYAAGMRTSIYIFVLLTVAVVLFLIAGVVMYSGHRSGDRVSQSKPENDGIEGKTKHAKRKYLMLIGILVASATYRAGLSPPGGAWQSSSDWYRAGDFVMHSNRRPRYLIFFYSNSISLVASIVIIIMLLPKWQNKEWSLKVMNKVIFLDLLALLAAYVAGSSRGWKTSMYVVVLIAAVLAYVAVHVMLALSCPNSVATPKDLSLGGQGNAPQSHEQTNWGNQGQLPQMSPPYLPV